MHFLKGKRKECGKFLALTKFRVRLDILRKLTLETFVQYLYARPPRKMSREGLACWFTSRARKRTEPRLLLPNSGQGMPNTRQMTNRRSAPTWLAMPLTLRSSVSTLSDEKWKSIIN